MRVIVKTEGFAELDEGLMEFSKATSRNIIRRSLIKAGEPIMNDAKAAAPRLSGKLEMSIGSGTKLSRRQRKLHKSSGGIGDVEVFVGAGALVQAITQEFGTVDQPAQPFMRPAWDANSGRALSIMKTELTSEISKAAQRAARKAARILAKKP